MILPASKEEGKKLKKRYFNCTLKNDRTQNVQMSQCQIQGSSAGVASSQKVVLKVCIVFK